MAALVRPTSARYNGPRTWERREGRFFGTSGSTRDGYAGGERGRDAIAFFDPCISRNRIRLCGGLV